MRPSLVRLQCNPITPEARREIYWTNVSIHTKVSARQIRMVDITLPPRFEIG
jgi:hypothetical protein